MNYCDTHDFRVAVPNPNPDIHGMRITLTFTDSPSAVDLDLYVWNNDDPVFGPAYTQSLSPDKNEEVAQAGEPETGTYWLTVINHKGINTGYSLKLEWTVLDDLGPSYERPQRGTTFSGRGERPRSQDITAASRGDFGDNEAPTPTLSPIKVPGPDGELTEQTLPILVSGRGRAAPEQGIGPMLITTITVLVMAAVGLGTFFVLRRRRRATEA